MFRLYSTPLSANGRKALAVVHHLELAPEIVQVNVYKGEGRTREFLAVNPLGKIPALIDGDLTLWESNAILIYLSEAHGGHRLWSREPKRRADIARWLFWESSQWQPALVPVLTPTVAALLFGTPPPAAVGWNDAGVEPMLQFLESELQRRQYVAGDELTLADFSVAGMMTYLRAAHFPFADFAGIAAWYARIEALPAWQATAVEPWR